MNVELYLKENKIRTTKSRRIIVQILEESENAVTAEYIYQRCKEYGEKLDLSTVYRTLDLFSEKEIVNKFPIDKGKYNYIFKDKWHKHILKCDCCNKEVEIDCPMLQIEEIIKNRTGFTLIEEEIKLRCICEECRKNKKNTMDKISKWNTIKK